MGIPTPGDLPYPGIEPRSPALQADALPSEPPGKPMNTGVGSLPLLQGELPDPGVEQGSVSPIAGGFVLFCFCFQVDSLPTKLPGKSQVGSLPLQPPRKPYCTVIGL